MADTWTRLNDVINTKVDTEFDEKTSDAQGQFPRAEYWYKSSLTKENHQLNVPGDPTIDTSTLDPDEKTIEKLLDILGTFSPIAGV